MNQADIDAIVAKYKNIVANGEEMLPYAVDGSPAKERDIALLAEYRLIIAALESAKGWQSPVARMYQHDESTRLNFIGAGEDHEAWERINPRWNFVCSLYSPPTPGERS